MLAVARRLGQAPREVVVIGVIPADVTWGLELSAPLRQRLPEIVQLVLEEVDETACR
jgi:hypothetical protein